MVTDHGLGVIEANMLCNFGLAAISICSMADPIVSDNTIQIGEGGDKDTRYAILVRDQGRGQVQNNRLEGWAAPESDPAPVPKAVPEAAAAKLKPATGSTSGKSPLRNRPGTSAQGPAEVKRMRDVRRGSPLAPSSAMKENVAGGDHHLQGMRGGGLLRCHWHDLMQCLSLYPPVREPPQPWTCRSCFPPSWHPTLLTSRLV
eukprot:GGOE01003599.1.p1 GENE.GGOE01003599.1~~GGOE01003599.1.p1  ORF type:complete len:202 (-),score=25.50 GGOE01003599.1:132-737(-)